MRARRCLLITHSVQIGSQNSRLHIVAKRVRCSNSFYGGQGPTNGQTRAARCEIIRLQLRAGELPLRRRPVSRLPSAGYLNSLIVAAALSRGKLSSWDFLTGSGRPTKFQFSDTPSAEQENARKRAQAIAPVVWLLGKTGLGKTAIIAALTGEGFSGMSVAGTHRPGAAAVS